MSQNSASAFDALTVNSPNAAPYSTLVDSDILLPTDRCERKIVRVASTDSLFVTLAHQWLDTVIVVASLELTLHAFGLPSSLGSIALGLVALLLSRHIFSASGFALGSKSGGPIKFVFSRWMLLWGAILAVLSFLAFTFRGDWSNPGRLIVAWTVATALALLVGNLVQAFFTRWPIGRRGIMHRFIIIGVNDLGLELLRRLERTTTYGRFLGFFDFRSPDRLTEARPDQMAGHCRDLTEFVRRQAIDAVYIALPMSKAPRINGLLQELRDTTATIYFVPNVFAFELVQARCVDIGGMPALSICDTPFQGIDGLRKRLSDVVIAVLAMVALSPLLIAIALAVKLTSVGPVLFTQRRYGLNGQEILVYKFRSMIVCEDRTEVTQATRKDPRTTRVGSFLRRTSLDELPQLINVLLGSMSFVGPRPHAVAHNEQYRRLINGYMLRHKVRPGITGLAQVNGLRGETETVEKMFRRVQFDLEYVKNWSLALDMQIILKTALKVFRDGNAY
jgi:putative colanic acid biosysnthesis UDP-glucose lipid carrier transferase